jgi:hypothetical protein
MAGFAMTKRRCFVLNLEIAALVPVLASEQD